MSSLRSGLNGSDRRAGSRSNGGVDGDSRGRAERFEDAKRRIIDSCFSKKEADGAGEWTARRRRGIENAAS